ncbi:MAG: tRNA (N6-isopentenyl adenosine(37)-C2)-methylthiotransferase MiaB [Proteobacteria bacterium]|nr:tRNA (N6-isopentenyl adenosine(37)-C2)-methylthiotransferase MiaB [Pseudomonadota bacterium]
MESFYIETYGCQMNEADSEYMASILMSLGFERAENLNKADIILVNTCSIREKAEKKVLSFVGRVRPFKEQKNIILGVCGCVAKQEGEKLLGKAPYIDMIFGPYQINKLPELLSRVKSLKKPVIALDDEACFQRDVNALVYPGVRAFIPIMQGCNNFCSYCIVPYVRGREVSREEEEILYEVKRLAKLGVKEVMLLGQNVNSYALDRGVKDGFVSLIEKVSKVEGIERIRFTTSHPKDLTDSLINAFGYIDKLCPHIHLPVQSGSNKVLSLMNRRYSREEYLEKVYKLRKVCPEISITTDIIVGFPGEDDRDFEDTLDLYKQVNFDSAFSFKFSPRPGTKASNMTNIVPEEIKQSRLEILQELQKSITYDKNKMLENKILPVLIESKSKKNEGEFVGRTPCFRVTNIICNNVKSLDMIGQIVDVKILKGLKNSLKAQLVNGD